MKERERPNGSIGRGVVNIIRKRARWLQQQKKNGQEREPRRLLGKRTEKLLMSDQ